MPRSTPPRLCAFVLPLLVAACGGGDSTPGATTPAEAQMLNDAAAMMDANSVDMNAVAINETDEEQPQ